MAVTDYEIPATHPRTVAISPTIPVTTPIIAKALKKHAFPPQILVGGMIAKNTFHPIDVKWQKASKPSTSSRIKLSSSN
jgi:hypothetical protein